MPPINSVLKIVVHLKGENAEEETPTDDELVDPGQITINVYYKLFM